VNGYLSRDGWSPYGTNQFAINVQKLGYPPKKRTRNGRPEASDSVPLASGVESLASDSGAETSDSGAETSGVESPESSFNHNESYNSGFAAIESAAETSDPGSLASDTELWDFSSEKQKSADSTPGTDSTQERKKSVELAPPNAPPPRSSERNSSSDAPLSAGQHLFLEAFGAKRFKTHIQRETVAELEQRFGDAKLKEYVTWAAKLGMSLGKAVVGAEKALAKWGRNSSSEKPVVSTKGTSTASGTVVPDGDGYYVG
jgi:hypothetical protein